VDDFATPASGGAPDLHVAQLLAPTIAPLSAAPTRVFDRLRSLGFRGVQLGATQAGTRPRDLDRSARRDLVATLRRREMIVAGLDAWIPPSHLRQPAHVDRAMAALLDTIALAEDLGRCPVSLTLPPAPAEGEADEIEAVATALARRAERSGVALADHAVPDVVRDSIGVGVDPPAWLAHGDDPAAVVARVAPRLVSARLCDLLTTGERGPIGDEHGARLDTVAYRAALSVAPRPVPVVVDARQWADPWSGLQRTALVWGLG
jgi:sugar phosphate isomerase/epimerase